MRIKIAPLFAAELVMQAEVSEPSDLWYPLIAAFDRDRSVIEVGEDVETVWRAAIDAANYADDFASGIAPAGTDERAHYRAVRKSAENLAHKLAAILCAAQA